MRPLIGYIFGMEPGADPPALTRYLAAIGRDPTVDATCMPVLLAELGVIARSALRTQRQGHTLQPTALVHEAWLKLVGGEGASFRDRSHFFATAALAMRQVLVDHARARRSEKRGGRHQAVTLHTHLGGATAPPEVDLLDLDQAVSELEELDERRARVVVLRYFGGLEVDEVAEVMGVSKTTVERDWRAARAWLWQRLRPE